MEVGDTTAIVHMASLVSGDGESFDVPKNVASLSKYAAAMLQDVDEDADEDDIPVIHLPMVKGAVLKRVTEFLQHHSDDPLPTIPKPLSSMKFSEIIPQWYATFVEELSQESLFELVLAANYMDIPALLELGCASVALLIKNKKTPQEIASLFGVDREYIAPDEKKIREQFPWSEEV